MPSFAISQFIILLEPLWVSAVFLLLSTGPLLYIIWPQCQVMTSKMGKKIAPLLKGEGLYHLYNTYFVALITRLAKQSKA